MSVSHTCPFGYYCFNSVHSTDFQPPSLHTKAFSCRQSLLCLNTWQASYAGELNFLVAVLSP